jgi:hypothetical protein
MIPAVTEDAPGAGPAALEDDAVLVAWALKRRSVTRHFAALLLHGSRVGLVDADGDMLLDVEGAELSAGIAGPSVIELHEPDGTVRYIVGPLPQWGRRGRGAELVERYAARVTPDPELVAPESRVNRLMVTPATSQLRRMRQWPPVLMAMLAARGVTRLDL